MKNPAEGSNPLSFLFLWYTRHIFWKCKRRKLRPDDVCEPMQCDESEYLGDCLEKEWKAELEHQKRMTNKKSFINRKPLSYRPSLKKALFRTFFWKYQLLSLLQTTNALVINVYLPVFLGHVIRYFEEKRSEEYEEILWQASGMILLKAIGVLLNQHAKRLALVLGLRARVACSALIYNKSLRLAVPELDQNTVANVLNLTSGNLNCFDTHFRYLNYTWITPIQIILITKIMWDKIGPSVLAGISILLVLSVTINSTVFYSKKTLDPKIALLTDRRMNLINELISKIKILKMYAWEKPFEKIIAQTRSAELRKIHATECAKSVLAGTPIYADRLAVLAALVLFFHTSDKLTAEVSFVTIVYFNTLHWTVIHYLPQGLTSACETTKSVKLVEEYLLGVPEVNASKVNPGENYEKIRDDEEYRVPAKLDFLNASANWRTHQLPPALNRLSFRIQPGSLCGIIGDPGAGKTALLSLILRELPLGYGSVVLSQSDDDHFNHRGFYMDPGLRMSYASQVTWCFAGSVRDNIVFGQSFNNGRYTEVTKVCALERLPDGDQTSVKKLTNQQRALVHLARAVYRVADLYLLDDMFDSLDPSLQQKVFDECVDGFLRGKTRVVVTKNLGLLRRADTILVLERGNLKYHGAYEKLGSEIPVLTSKKENHQSCDDDDESSVSERRDLWRDYFRLGGSRYLISFFVSTLVASQVLASGTDFWLANWIDENARLVSHPGNLGTVYVYAGLCVILCLFKNYALTRICGKSSEELHRAMFSGLIRTSVDFFNVNSPGRISARFYKDTGVMDESLAYSLSAAVQASLMIVGIFVIVSIVDLWMLLLVLKIVVVFLCAKTIFSKVALEIDRLEASTQVTVLQHVRSTLRGLTTIRSCSWNVCRSKKNFHSSLNAHASTRWLALSTRTAFEIFVDLTLLAFNAAVVYKFVLPRKIEFSGTQVGLALSQALILFEVAQWGFGHYVRVVLGSKSLERILDYANLPNESSGTELMTLDWPKRGRIVFGNVSMRDVLKNVNLTIESGWKVGIIGQSEDSPIVAALFRLGNLKGEIMIDGVNTENLDLHNLRTHVSIISQDATLFSQTLRFNLDPFGNHDDSVLHEALHQVQLTDLSLDQEVGNDIDLDRRLLVCLARAVLDRNLILVVDEPVLQSNTKIVLRDTIRRRFAHSTVVTLARGPNSVIECDRVVVLDNGVVVEVGCPHELLSGHPGGHFSRMVTGERASERLRKLAEEACLRNVQQRSLDITDVESR